MFKLVKRIEGFETKLQALESPDSDKRAKSYTKTKIGSEIAIRNNHGKSEKKKNGRTVKERTFVNREKPTNAFVKTNGSVNARKIRKPKKMI